MEIKQSLEVVSRTGRYLVGFKKSIQACLAKRAVILIVSEKAEESMKKAAKSVSEVAGIPLLVVNLSPSEIGVALRKNFSVATMAIIDPGSADFRLEGGETSE